MKSLRLLCWNVNGLRAIHRKGLFLDWLVKERPDVLAIQETKLQEDQVPEELWEVLDYKVYFNSAQRKGYSGVGLWSRPQPVEVTQGFGVKRFDAEGRTLVADYGDFLLYNVYFPNGGQGEERLQYKYDFYDAFLKHLKKVKKTRPNILVCGDVNTAHKEIDLARPKENESNTGFLPDERAWIDKLLASGFCDTFRMFEDGGENYTWWDYKTRARERNVGWRIDYFFVSEAFKDNVEGARILADVVGSDHCPIEVQIGI
ncbi:MAG: exodeoxyribonuclease III [Sedimentisphaerales bacterium]|nr:exodeoxyribonuclease III [Sedimentisphaerales bacterium]